MGLKLKMDPFIDHDAELISLADSDKGYALKLKIGGGEGLVQMDNESAIRLYKGLRMALRNQKKLPEDT